MNKDVDLQKLFKEEIKSIKKIEKGFSLDEKYIVDNKYIVRVIPLERYEQFKEVFRVQKAFVRLIALCQKAINLTKDNNFGYYITEYIEGKSGLEIIENLLVDKQYELGMIAAKEIVKFHKAYPLPTFDMKKHLDNYLNTKIEVAIDHNVEELLNVESALNLIYRFEEKFTSIVSFPYSNHISLRS